MVFSLTVSGSLESWASCCKVCERSEQQQQQQQTDVTSEEKRLMGMESRALTEHKVPALLLLRSPSPGEALAHSQEAPRGLERGGPCLDSQGGSRVLQLKVTCVSGERRTTSFLLQPCQLPCNGEGHGNGGGDRPAAGCVLWPQRRCSRTCA